MEKVVIGGVEYVTDYLTGDAKAQLACLQFHEAELRRLKATVAMHMASLNALNLKITKLAQAISTGVKQEVVPKNIPHPEIEYETDGLLIELFDER